jgi:hypothetical protein
MGGRRPPFKTAHVADSQRSSDPLLFTLALAPIANGDGRSANLPVVGGLLVIIRESRRSDFVRPNSNGNVRRSASKQQRDVRNDNRAL